jgi:ATP-dependent Clp protease ATP-binding subunit ClpX
MLSYDGVELEFTPEALTAVAELAVERKIGARGLRAVMEGILTPVMYEIPSDKTINKVTVTEASVRGGDRPLLERGEPKRIPAS